WTRTRYASGPGGTGTAPWPCSRTACWPGNAGKREDKAPVLLPAPDVVPRSVPDLRRWLTITLPLPPPTPAVRLAWSRWRRRHHARAHQAHDRAAGRRHRPLVPI